MLLKNDYYTYRILWSEEDNEFIGLCAEFPSLSWLAKTQESALKGIRSIVADVIQDMKNTGEIIPQPITTKNYSGKISLRVTPDIHRNIAIQAAEAGLSVNKLLGYHLNTKFAAIQSIA